MGWDRGPRPHALVFASPLWLHPDHQAPGTEPRPPPPLRTRPCRPGAHGPLLRPPYCAALSCPMGCPAQRSQGASPPLCSAPNEWLERLPSPGWNNPGRLRAPQSSRGPRLRLVCPASLSALQVPPQGHALNNPPAQDSPSQAALEGAPPRADGKSQGLEVTQTWPQALDLEP